MILRARLPILYRSTQYRIGDPLPADNADTVAAWLEAGSAYWYDEEQEAHAPVKAKMATAPPGLPGISSDGDPEALSGRAPDRPERKRPAARRKK